MQCTAHHYDPGHMSAKKHVHVVSMCTCTQLHCMTRSLDHSLTHSRTHYDPGHMSAKNSTEVDVVPCTCTHSITHSLTLEMKALAHRHRVQQVDQQRLITPGRALPRTREKQGHHQQSPSFLCFLLPGRQSDRCCVRRSRLDVADLFACDISGIRGSLLPFGDCLSAPRRGRVPTSWTPVCWFLWWWNVL